MRRTTLLFLIACAAVPLSAAAQTPIFGFNNVSSDQERTTESHFDAALSAADQREWLEKLSARPHHLGSARGLENAVMIRDLMLSWGFDSQIETFKVLFPTPKLRVLTLDGPNGYRAKLREPSIEGDSTTRSGDEALPPYNAYSCDGNVHAGLVYVNYGLPADYEQLDRLGISVKGKIVLARYGGSWRGVKPKVAAEHGAVGCILYTDPRDDGYYQGNEYPEGGWRNRDSVQRGSVAEMTLYPGDALTPGVGATANAPRIDRKDAPTITKIPTLPIGWGDAEPLLRSLGGPVVPEGWRGALPFTYHVGPSRSAVHLEVAFNWNMVDARDVISKIEGTESPDEWIIRGNHHDGWVCGAEDPLSGQVALLSEGKALGELLKTGWRPKRTIVYCSWDGEEPGLLGSTEWAETHAAELSDKAVAYINTDSNGRGFLGAEGSAALSRLITGVAADVPDPETSLSVLDRDRARDLVGSNEAAKKLAKDKADLELGALGSGSDYCTFVHHLGIPALDLGFGGEGEGTQYHSAYDTFAWYTRFGDPSFAYGVTLSKTVGRTVLRLAQADALPFDHHAFVGALEKYLKELVDLLEQKRKEAEDRNRELLDGTLAASEDPTKHLVLPSPLDPTPALDFSALKSAIALLRSAVDSAETPTSLPVEARGRLDPNPQEIWNTKMVRAERAILGPGLPGRPWYRDVVSAPGEYTGYGAKTFPGVREAIEARNWTRAQEQIKIAAETITHFASGIASK